jgi:hypothetical protein
MASNGMAMTRGKMLQHESTNLSVGESRCAWSNFSINPCRRFATESEMVELVMVTTDPVEAYSAPPPARLKSTFEVQRAITEANKMIVVGSKEESVAPSPAVAMQPPSPSAAPSDRFEWYSST